MLENMKNISSNCLSSLSIVVDDFDSEKNNSKDFKSMPESSCKPQQKLYSRQSSDASIKKMMEEVEERKNNFCKLIDEHSAVIENLKKIEQMNSSCNISNTIKS